MKPKTCDNCKSKFTPVRHLQVACGPMCGLELARKKRERDIANAKVKDRRETKQKLEKIKPRSKWLAEAQAAVNMFVRLRDADLPCISCGRFHQGQYHAGHFLSVGARPELRYELTNIHKQCSACNNYLSGNIVLYRIALIEKIGLERVEWLEGPHEPKKYTIDDLKEIKATYTAKARELQKEMK